MAAPYPYRSWLEQHDTLSNTDLLEIRSHIERLVNKPLITVVMPVFNTPELLLRRAIDSVRNQLYPHWELCIADDASSDPIVQKLLEEYARADSRIKVKFRTRRGHISIASNTALDLAGGDYIALLDHDDMLAEHALYRVAVEINRYPAAVLIYSDEDKIDQFGQRFDPYFKPDWNPQLLLSQNFICHLGVYKTEVVRTLGGFREGLEGAQDYDLALRVSEQAPPGAIRHIPGVLYHWGVAEGSMATAISEKPYALVAARRAIEAHLDRLGMRGEVRRLGKSAFFRVHHPLPSPQPMVSIIVPTRNAKQLLQRCLNSIFSRTRYENYEVIVIDNESDEEDALHYLNRLKRHDRVRVISYDHPFNYSAINNLAAGEAKGEVLCLLNNDTEVISPDWLDEMLGHLLLPNVGVVGAKLLYLDGSVQHAGILLHPKRIAVHAHAGISKRESGYFGRAMLAQDFMAVTGACLTTRKAIFEQLGGLDEVNLPVAFNDVDFCLRVREAGYRVLWTPSAQLYHHESVSRGRVDTPEKRRRFRQEKAYMRRRWNKELNSDPFYNPNLTLDRPDFSLSEKPVVDRPWRS